MVEKIGGIDTYKEIEENILKKYPEIKKFENSIVIFNEHHINKIFEKVKNNIQCLKYKILQLDNNLYRYRYKSLDDTEEELKEEIETNPQSFYAINKNFAIISFKLVSDHPDGIFIFYNNYEDIKHLIISSMKKISCGYYEIKEIGGRYTFNKIDIQKNNNLILETNLYYDIKQDIEYFFKNKKFYLNNKLTYKRGVLLYGPPGNGKTTLIRELMTTYKDVYSFIIDSKVDITNILFKNISEVSGDAKKIIILEDLDRYQEHNLSSLLNAIDGIFDNDSFYIIATCNDLYKIDKALINRPSRFDKIYVVDYPNEEQRKEFIKFYFPKINKQDLAICIKLTEKFNCAYFKEIFISSKIHNLSPIESIEYVKKRLEIFNSKKNNSYTG